MATSLTNSHNLALTSMVSSFNASYTDVSMMIYDLYEFFVNLITNAAQEGFTVSPVTTPCYGAIAFYPGLTAGFANSVCSDSHAHIFWDGVHLTQHASELLGQSLAAIFPQLQESWVDVINPGTVLYVWTLGMHQMTACDLTASISTCTAIINSWYIYLLECIYGIFIDTCPGIAIGIATTVYVSVTRHK